jgi:murein DD-endopeptidase MepM/ murein hydrolase activator NlpD
MSAQVRGQDHTTGRMGRETLRLSKGVLTVGLVISLCGLISNNPEQPRSAVPFASFFLVPPVEASGPPTADLSESAPIPLLNAWPDIVDEPVVENETRPSPTRKRTMERPLPGIARKTMVGPRAASEADLTNAAPQVNSTANIVLASLFTESEPQPISTGEVSQPAPPVTEDGAEVVTNHDPEEETPVEGDISSEEGDGVPFDEETPVYTDEELQQIQSDQPVSAPAPATEPAPAPATEKKNGRKGYVIRVEGDDLVVYDAQGNEIYRKGKSQTRSKTHLSRIKDAASKLEEEVSQPEITGSVQSEGFTPPANGDLVFHEVMKGENPSIIARKYPGLTAQKLMEANGITNPASIQIGTKLWVPNTVQGVTHVVQQGETLSDLLKKYEVDNLFEVCDVNGLSRDTNEVAVGTVLVIPGAKVKPQAPVKKRPTAIMIDPASFKGRAGWTWPVENQIEVSSPYGLRVDPFSLLKKKSGVAAGGGKDGVKRSFHHGIDLAMPIGTPVKAARDGEVMKVSQSRWGHGRMVQILHEDGWSTVYSHNSKILVKVGDRVRQGDVVALSGNTGRSTGPHLHFEVRRPDQRSVDPKRFLSALD